MNETIIRNHNNTVKPNDTVYHLGDFVVIWRDSFKLEESFPEVKRILKQLNGHHHLILGNHDNLGIDAYKKAGFLSVHARLEIGKTIFIHDRSDLPIQNIQTKKIVLVGHTHSHIRKTFTQKCTIINVGVDAWNFVPVNINKIEKLIKGDK